MDEQQFISIRKVCLNYDIEVAFIESLQQIGLIELHTVAQDPSIHKEHLSQLERMIRLHTDLNINLEGIDVICNLLEKERRLHAELNHLRNRLSRYENDAGV